MLFLIEEQVSYCNSLIFIFWQRHNLPFTIPPGIAMPPAGLCFTDDFLFWLSPLSFDNNGCTDRNADCCFNTVYKKIAVAKIWWISVKGRCHSKQFCGAKWRQVGMKCLYCLCWYFTKAEKIAKPIPTQRPLMYALHLVKIWWTFVSKSLWPVCTMWVAFQFKCGPSHSTTRTWTRIVAIMLSMKKSLRLQIWWTLVQ